jgi:hypothetical protein
MIMKWLSILLAIMGIRISKIMARGIHFLGMRIVIVSGMKAVVRKKADLIT